MPLIERNEDFKPNIASKIPISRTNKVKSILKKQNGGVSSTGKVALRRTSQSSIFKTHITNKHLNSNTKSNIRNPKNDETDGFACRDNGTATSNIFVWQTGKQPQETFKKKDVLWMAQVQRGISSSSEAKQQKAKMAADGKALGNCFVVSNTKCYESVSTAKGTGGGHIENKLEEKDGPALPKTESSTTLTSRSFFGRDSDKAASTNLPFELESVVDTADTRVLKKIDTDEHKTVQQYTAKRSPKTSLHESEIGNKITKENHENTKLREQIEKLSSFIESSEDLRERSESLLMQQKKQLEKEIREKDVMKNKVCCLEELRRNVQRKLDEQVEENKSLKHSLKNTEVELFEEKEKLKMLKKECSAEVSKNAELELVLQTVLEELGCANKLLKMTSEGTRFISNRHEKGSIEYMVNSEENWKRERSQFEGKIKLLEMDKKKLRSHIESLEERIVELGRIGRNLRENNEVLEFRITELEIELSQLIVKTDYS